MNETTIEPAVLPLENQWDLAIETAVSHRVLPVVLHVLGKGEHPGAPVPAFHRLRQRASEIGAWNLTLTRELTRLVQLFEERDIQVIAFKGPLLAHTAYGNLAMRACTDLDFLFRPAQMPDVRDALQGAGYRLYSAIHWPCDEALVKSRVSEICFVHEERSICIDAHWDLLPGYLPLPVEPRCRLERAKGNDYG